MSEVAPRLDEAGAAAAAQRLLDEMAKTTGDGSHARDAVLDMLGVVAPRLGAAGAAAAEARILDKLEKDSKLDKDSDGRALIGADQVLNALALNLDEGAADKAAQEILDVLHKITPNNVDLSSTQSEARGELIRVSYDALKAVAPRLSEAGADAAARRLLDEQEPQAAMNSFIWQSLHQTMKLLAPRMGPACADAAAHSILVELSKRGPVPDYPKGADEDDEDALDALLPRLGEAEAAAAASRILYAMARNRYMRVGPNRPQFSLTNFQALVAKLSLQGKVQLLKDPVCVGRPRDAILLQLGKELDHNFADVWELVDWLADHRPDIDVMTPPQPPQS